MDDVWSAKWIHCMSLIPTVLILRIIGIGGELSGTTKGITNVSKYVLKIILFGVQQSMCLKLYRGRNGGRK